MGIEIKSTSDINVNSVKMLVYGQSGSGKTSLIKTLPEPIVLSAEGGLLSISDSGIPYIEISTIDDLREAYYWLLQSDESKKYQSVAIDSISEVAEVVLLNEKKINKDGRAAYGEMQETMTEIIRLFRDLPNKNIYMSAKIEKSQDEMQRMLYQPSMPGNKMSQQLSYFFDEVLALRVEKDQDGKNMRTLMSDSDGLWSAKDRSGKLDQWENPDLGMIINKIKKLS